MLYQFETLQAATSADNQIILCHKNVFASVKIKYVLDISKCFKLVILWLKYLLNGAESVDNSDSIIFWNFYGRMYKWYIERLRLLLNSGGVSTEIVVNINH